MAKGIELQHRRFGAGTVKDKWLSAGGGASGLTVRFDDGETRAILLIGDWLSTPTEVQTAFDGARDRKRPVKPDSYSSKSAMTTEQDEDISENPDDIESDEVEELVGDSCRK